MRRKNMKDIGGHFVFFQTSSRLKNSLEVCEKELGGNCNLFIGREITKKFETLWRGKITEYLQNIEDINTKVDKKQCGEFVMIIEVFKKKEVCLSDEKILEWIHVMRPHLKDSELAGILSKKMKITKNYVYSLLKKYSY